MCGQSVCVMLGVKKENRARELQEVCVRRA
jgi:hypothetical protein